MFLMGSFPASVACLAGPSLGRGTSLQSSLRYSFDRFLLSLSSVPAWNMTSVDHKNTSGVHLTHRSSSLIHSPVTSHFGRSGLREGVFLFFWEHRSVSQLLISREPETGGRGQGLIKSPRPRPQGPAPSRPAPSAYSYPLNI